MGPVAGTRLATFDTGTLPSVVEGTNRRFSACGEVRNCLSTRNCTSYCYDAECFTPELAYDYEFGCRPPVEVNCSAACFGELCAPMLTFCSVYDEFGQLRHADVNCSYGFNVTFQPQWYVNRSLGDSVDALMTNPSSALSLHLGLNSTLHVCYNDCVNLSVSEYGDSFFFHKAPIPTRVALNCTSTCYAKACVNSCLDNCTRAEEEAALLVDDSILELTEPLVAEMENVHRVLFVRQIS